MPANRARTTQSGTRRKTQRQSRPRRRSVRAVPQPVPAAEGLLDTFPAHVALLDAHGRIIFTNAAWRRFAEENGFRGEAGIGDNYLEVCDRTRGIEADDARQVASGIRAVLDGNSRMYTFEYPCHAPDRQRWFLMRVTPVAGHAGALVAHVDVTERALAGQALRRSEARLRAIIDHEPECVKVVSADGRLLDMNPAGLRMIEADDASRVLGSSIDGLIHPDDRAAFMEAHRRACAGSTETLQFRIVGLRGTVRWMETHSVPLREGEGAATSVLSVTRDITERRRLEEEAARKARITELLEALARSANEADGPKAAMRASLALIARFGNWTLARLGLYERGASLRLPDDSVWEMPDGQRFEDFIRASAHEDYFRPDGQFVSRVLRGKKAVWIEDLGAAPKFGRMAHALQHGLRSAFAFPVVVDGDVAAFLEFFAEAPRAPEPDLIDAAEAAAAQLARIIERHRAERELHAVSQRNAALVTALGQIVYDWHPQSDRLVWDGNYTEVLGYLPREMGADTASWTGRVHSHDLEGVLAELGAVTREHRNYDLEYRFRHRDGSYRWVRDTGVPFFDAKGDLVRVIGVLTDITARRLAEEERSALLAREQAAREAADEASRHYRALYEQLEQSELMLRMALQVSRMGPWVVELTDHAVTWSDEVRTIHEVAADFSPTLEEGIAFYAPECRDAIRVAFEACANDGTPFDLELEIVTARGRRVWVRAIGEAVRDDTERIVRVQGALQDISERKQAESRERKLVDQLASTLEHISDAFFTMDSEWRVQFMNSMAERLLQRTRGELVGKVVWDEFPDAVGTTFHKQYHLAVAEREAVHFEAFYAPLGVWFDVSAYPSESGLAVYFRDVTQRKRMEAVLRESEERFRYVAQATADTIWDWNLLTDSVWWNSGMQTVFGYNLGDIEPDASSWTNRIHPDDREEVLHSIHGVIDGAATNWEHKYRFRRADGTYATVVDRGFVIRNARGRAIRMVGGMTDITDRLQLEDQLRQAQRLESVGQLTGGVAHDFNNFLTVILGNAELLEEQLSGNPQLRVLAQMISGAAQRGAELTQRLLAFARKQVLDPKPVDVNQLVGRMEPLLRRALGEHVEMRFTCAGEPWQAMVDPGQLESAVLNLSINARDAMPGGGRLTIETANVTISEEQASHSAEAKPGDYVLVAVSDTGEGIPSEHLARIFEPFFTTKGKGRGTGLGLAMVHGFVKQSGGHISVYSERGAGTTFKLYLPRSGVRAPEAAQPGAEERRGGGESVLLVEDDTLVRRYAQEQLVSLGYRVTTAGSGPEALEILRRHEDIDLLFTDVMMPGGMTGRQLAEAARRLRPDLKVLYTSGYTEDAIMHHGRLDPGVLLLGKPYRRADLAAKLRQALQPPGN